VTLAWEGDEVFDRDEAADDAMHGGLNRLEMHKDGWIWHDRPPSDG
jgi:hypothetical protein